MNEKILSDFKQKILAEKIPDAKVEEVEGGIEIKTSHTLGKINFYVLNLLICEMSVTNLANDENKFYLHFELRDLSQAEENFHAMLRSFDNLDGDRPLRILFSCTGGLTTGYFAEKLNEASKILSRKFQFEAMPATELKNISANYDVIMLAPQIAYQIQEISRRFPDTLVLKIPPKIFAGYDTNALIKFFNWYSKYGGI